MMLKMNLFVGLSLGLMLSSPNVFALSFSDLSSGDQEKVKQGTAVSLAELQGDAKIRDTSFQYIVGANPEEAAAVYFDFESQQNYLPGLTYSHVVKHDKTGTDKIMYGLNPSIFFSSLPEKLSP